MKKSPFSQETQAMIDKTLLMGQELISGIKKSNRVSTAWSIKQWAIHIDKTLTTTRACKECCPGASCTKHSDSFWRGIDGLRKAVRVEKTESVG